MLVHSVTVHTDLGDFTIPFGAGWPSSQEGDHTEQEGAPIARGNVEAGLAAALITDGHTYLVNPEGYPDPVGTNAFIDHLAEVVGFSIPSGHRSDLTPSEGVVGPDWNYWDADSNRGSEEPPSPEEIVDALDAAYVALSAAGPSNAACIAFIFGFENGMPSSH
jgi:hypothetical protein